MDFTLFESSDAHSSSCNRFEGLDEQLKQYEAQQLKFKKHAHKFITDLTRTNAHLARRKPNKVRKMTDLLAR